MIAADGHVVWVHDVSIEIVGEPSSPRSWQAFLVDVTSRHRTEEQLVESEERYRELIDHSPDAILVHADGRFVFANPAAAELLAAEIRRRRSSASRSRRSSTPTTGSWWAIASPANGADRSPHWSRRSSSGWTAGRSSSRSPASRSGTRAAPQAGSSCATSHNARRRRNSSATPRRYRALVEHIPAVVYIGDRRRRHASASTSARRWRRSSDTRSTSGAGRPTSGSTASIPTIGPE